MYIAVTGCRKFGNRVGGNGRNNENVTRPV